MRSPTFWVLPILFASVLPSFSCKEPSESAGPCASVSLQHDGVYGVSRHADGSPTGVGTFAVADGFFAGDFLGVNGGVDVEGCVLPGGDIAFEKLDATDGHRAEASASLIDGVLEGLYTLTTSDGVIEGEIQGSLNNRVSEDSHTTFDGVYDVQFVVGGEPSTTAVFQVENSGFYGAVDHNSGSVLDVQGFISSDGLIVLTGVTGSLKQTLGEGQVDHETFEASGVYRFGDEVGTFTAQRRES